MAQQTEGGMEERKANPVARVTSALRANLPQFLILARQARPAPG
ncbi:hypothetical protein LCGC14_2064440, partial [marine sediment metagenome]